MSQFPIFLINLDSSTERLEIACKALASSGAEFERLPAYDGRGTDPISLEDYSSRQTRAYMGRDMTGGEVGCYFSHIRAVQAFLQCDADYALVLEDDALPNQNAIELIQALIDWQAARGDPDWYLCHLGNPRMKYLTKVGDIAVTNDTRGIYRAHYFPVTTSALLWTRAGAAEFAKRALPITGPVDHILRSWLTEVDRGLALLPPVFSTTEAPSDIDTSPRRRRAHNRSAFYGWLKAKRMYRDKWRAWRHQSKFARQRARSE